MTWFNVIKRLLGIEKKIQQDLILHFANFNKEGGRYRIEYCNKHYLYMDTFQHRKSIYN